VPCAELTSDVPIKLSIIMSAPPSAELVYFEGRGLAEIIRLTLSAADIPFKEVDLTTRDQFLALKPELLFEQVPLLRIDGLKLVQSASIVRYVARKAHLLGTTDLEIARVDELYAGTRDAYQAFHGIAFQPEAAVKEGIETSLNKYLPIFNQLLKASGSGWLVGAGLTLADLGLLELLLATLDYNGPDALQQYPALVKFHATLTAQDNIRRYIASVRRPPTTPQLVATVGAVLNKTF